MVNNCQLCGAPIKPIFVLENMPKAAQFFPTEQGFEEDCAINLVINQCSMCGLVQHNLPPVSYYKEVITAAGLSEATINFRRAEFKKLVDTYQLKGKSVLEIGCGQGLVLDILKEVGLAPIGLEAGKTKNSEIVSGYITEMNNDTLFSSFVCLNYLEHLPKIDTVIKKIYSITTEDTIGYITVPNLNYLLSNCLYEFVADHISYFTQDTLAFAFAKNGFAILENYLINNDNDIVLIVTKKIPLELDYSSVEKIIDKLQKNISSFTKDGKKVAIWGAGHRTLALLALGNITGVSYIVDDCESKQNKLSPLTHIPIVSSRKLLEEPIDFLIVMVPGIYPKDVLKKVEDMKLKFTTIGIF